MGKAVRRSGLGMAALLLVAGCHEGGRVTAHLRALTDSIAADSLGHYDAVEVTAAWRALDSAVLMQLNAGDSLQMIQRWLTAVAGGLPDSLVSDSIPTLIARGARPLSLSNSIAFLGTGGGSDSALILSAALGMISGPGHLAVFTKEAGSWRKGFSYANDEPLWLQGRPLTAEEGWIVGEVLHTRADGGSADLIGWRVSGGTFHPLVVEDTTSLEAADFVSPPDGIVLEGAQYARGLSYGNPDPRVEERWILSVKGDTLIRTVIPLNPWMDVIDRFYLAVRRGRVAEARALVVSEELRKLLWFRDAGCSLARGDTAQGWGVADISGPEVYLRLLVQRGRDGRWRITKTVRGELIAGTPVFPSLTP